MRKCAWILHKRITNCELCITNVNCRPRCPLPALHKLVKMPGKSSSSNRYRYRYRLQLQAIATDTAAVNRICWIQIIFEHKNCNSSGSNGSIASWHPLPMAKNVFFSFPCGVHKIFLRFPPRPIPHTLPVWQTGTAWNINTIQINACRAYCTFSALCIYLHQHTHTNIQRKRGWQFVSRPFSQLGQQQWQPLEICCENLRCAALNSFATFPLHPQHTHKQTTNVANLHTIYA